MTSTMNFGPYSVELSSTDKMYFPEAGITKGDFIDYTRQIAETMIPYTKGRPLTMHRFPDGIDGEDFYQQNISDYFPDWIDRVTVDKEGGTVTHVVCNNAATLVYLANQACITPHIWLSRTDKLHYPDRMNFDLDPSDDDYDGARKAALKLRELLDELGLKTFVMTTGSQGYHVVAPLDRSQEFDTVRGFARKVAEVLAQRNPDQLTTEQRKNKRGDRIYIDTLRNSYAHTAVTPYAVRAKPGAPVATPVTWDELTGGDLHPQRYTINNIFRRLGQRDDPWKGMGRYARSLDEAQERLKQLAEESAS